MRWIYSLPPNMSFQMMKALQQVLGERKSLKMVLVTSSLEVLTQALTSFPCVVLGERLSLFHLKKGDPSPQWDVTQVY